MTVHFNSSACVHSCTVESCCSLCYSLSLCVKKKTVCVLACVAFSRSGYSLAGGVFPICWKGLTSLLGCSTDLLNSCVQGPRAKTPPTTVRRGVPGICTYPSLSQGEAPLMNKGDQVETYVPPPPTPPHPTRAALSTHLHSQTLFHTV